MRILLVAHAYPGEHTAGVEVYTQALARALCGEHEVHVLYRGCDLRQPEYRVTRHQDGAVRCYRLNNTFRQCYSFAGLYRNDRIDAVCAALVDEIRPDVAHVQHGLFLSAGIIGMLKGRGIPVAYTLHDYWLFCPQWHALGPGAAPCHGADPAVCAQCVAPWLRLRRGPKKLYQLLQRMVPASWLRAATSWYARVPSVGNDGVALINERRAYMRQVYADVDVFIAPSAYMRTAALAQGIPESKLALIRHGVAPLARPVPCEPGQPIRFGFIGTLLPAKGAHVLLEAFSRLPPGVATLRLHGARESYRGFEEYLPLVRRLAHTSGAVCAGAFDHGRIGEIFSSMDVLVVPSRWDENAPLTILEAQAAGVPVIASRIGGIPELVRDGVDGILVAPDDVQGLCAALRVCVQEPGRLARMRAATVAPATLESHRRTLEETYLRMREAH